MQVNFFCFINIIETVYLKPESRRRPQGLTVVSDRSRYTLVFILSITLTPT